MITNSGTIRLITVPGYEGWVIGGEIESEVGPMAVFSVHVPSSTRDITRRPYADEARTIIGLIREAVPPHVHLVIGGDFNFTLGERHASEARVTSTDERRALRAIEEAGLISCWTAAHPDTPLPQTLRWTGDRTPGRTTPYHCDGILVPRAWSERIQCVIHVDECFLVSDHNPVSAEVTLPAIDVPQATPALVP